MFLFFWGGELRKEPLKGESSLRKKKKRAPLSYSMHTWFRRRKNGERQLVRRVVTVRVRVRLLNEAPLPSEVPSPSFTPNRPQRETTNATPFAQSHSSLDACIYSENICQQTPQKKNVFRRYFGVVLQLGRTDNQKTQR